MSIISRAKSAAASVRCPLDPGQPLERLTFQKDSRQRWSRGGRPTRVPAIIVETRHGPLSLPVTDDPELDVMRVGGHYHA